MKVASRSSNLARAQVHEIENLLKISLDPIFIETYGDHDLKRPLRDLDKTDFFTREVDNLVLSGAADMAIHAAKDLPDPIPEGLAVFYTKGIDPRDALVMRHGFTLDTLPPGALIGSSSERRDAAVKSLRPDLVCKDIRGTIEARLSQLDHFHAIVIAEAALLRLNLNPNRIYLPGATTPMQGRLAITIKKENLEYSIWLDALIKKTC